MDPIKIGMQMPFQIMDEVHKLGLKGEALVRFGIMMDVALGSCQVSAVEDGLEAPVAAYREKIAHNLKRLAPGGVL